MDLVTTRHCGRADISTTVNTTAITDVLFHRLANRGWVTRFAQSQQLESDGAGL